MRVPGSLFCESSATCSTERERRGRRRRAACDLRDRRLLAAVGTAILAEVPGATLREVPLRGSELAHHLVDVLVDRMVSDVVLLDLTSLAVFTDYFVIGTVDNVRQLRAVTDALEEAARGAGLSMREEGAMSSGWVLVDFSDVVVHLFSMEKRAYYDLEELWSRAQEVVHIQ